MSYANLSDVRAAIPQIQITVTSRPTQDEVEQQIEQIEASLDITLANLGYATPVTGALSLRILKDMVVQETVSRVLHAQSLGVRDPALLGADRAHQLYVDRLRSLADPNDPFMLPDAARTDVGTKMEVEISSNFLDDPTDTDRITRDQVF